MKILCTKEEFKKIVQRCAVAVKESDCQVCIFHAECEWNPDFLPDSCELVPETNATE